MAIPQEIRLNKAGNLLTIIYEGETRYLLPAEYLRVCSPSAEVRGHGGSWQIIGHKIAVTIEKIIPVGQYALRLEFSDKHDSGIYSWEVLYDLCINHDNYWQAYLQGLAREGKTRE